jgi:hypothetical protein
MRWVRKAVLMGGARNMYKILVGKPERYTQLEISKVEACCTIKQLYVSTVITLVINCPKVRKIWSIWAGSSKKDILNGFLP